ncbi:MAG: aminotransferase class V-fold PLP-dependent enzyme [Arenicellales bacterium]
MTAGYWSHFGLGSAVWLNTAHQGALPIKAASAARQAVEWKVTPEELTNTRFTAVPSRLRDALARLMGSRGDEIALANSASYGLHLIANALPWRQGDEVIVMATDFPSDILPWLMLEQRFGVAVRRLRPGGKVLSPDELRAAITPRTRLFCITWVHSFSGHAIDIDSLGDICRAHDVLFVLNGSQAIGARALDVTRHPIDALTCVGFKWLCGPYGTGFCWLAPALLDRLQRTKAYWLSMLSADDLARDLGDLTVGPLSSAAELDIFGTANFFNFTAFAESVELLLRLGAANVEVHDQTLVQAVVDTVAETDFRLISPSKPSPGRSTLVLLTHPDSGRLSALEERLSDAGIRVAMRAGAVRISPHLYNTPAQIAELSGLLCDA